MLIKEKDKKQEQVDYLTELLERDIPENKKRLIERELNFIYSGDKGEASSEYYLNFQFKDSKNWALIHDLRIEHSGHVAQIDHLLIGRMMDVYVIESKNFSSGVEVSDDGDFSYLYKNKPYAIPSPVAQNERHIHLLNRFLTENSLLPKRLGVQLKPNYRNIVLISPESNLAKPKKGLFNSSAVMKGDKFFSFFKKDLESDSLNSLISISKVISSESLRGFTEKLAFLHEPKAIDYNAKFSITDDEPLLDRNAPNCPVCDKLMVQREVKKGKNKGKRFWGCSHYPGCDGTRELQDPINSKDLSEAESIHIKHESPVCPKCSKEMVKRVSKQGATKGNEFWGCSDFPKCKATVQLDEVKPNEADRDSSLVDEEPKCPKCNEPMVKRAAKKGDAAGKEFWGCSKFPKCRGVVSID